MIKEGATHIGVATDHVIESFRNELWAGYKTSEGIEPELWAQFPVLEEALVAMGVVVWPMVEFEADERVERVIICTPDKDLAQCVRGTRIVQMDRRTRTIRDEAGVVAKFGVPPESIHDYLALVGDAADGYPGLRGWGAKSAGRGPRTLRAPRSDPGGLARVASQGGKSREACEYVATRTGSSVPVSHSGDPAHRHCSFRLG